MKSRIFFIILVLGDIFAFSSSLLASNVVRDFFTYSEGPFLFSAFLSNYIIPFSFIFLVWLSILYLGGFYSTLLFIGYRLSLAERLLWVHFVNSIIAVAFFYLIPYFTIRPRISLFVYIILSYLFLFGWRILSISLAKSSFGSGALHFIGPVREVEELTHAFSHNPYYSGFHIIGSTDFSKLISYADRGLLAAVVSSPYQHNEKLNARFYELMFKGIKFLDFQKFYENVFHKIPVSLVSEGWFLENISHAAQRKFYDLFKRIVDIIISFFLGIISLPLCPFIVLAIKLDDGGPVFHIPKRIGQHGKIFNLLKFRTMRQDAGALWPKKNDSRVTRVGKFLRKTSLDELPQIWNILRGQLSLVGPRPDLLEFAEILRNQIPYYNIRTIIKPGLTGWAQVSQTVAGLNPSSVEETEARLAYDIYYIKNRSIILDLAIVLKTVKLVLTRIGFIR